MTISITIQNNSQAKDRPSEENLQTWIQTAIPEQTTQADITLRIIDIDEMTQLNTSYRSKPGPTNVLAFPYDPDEAASDSETTLQGDIAICAPIVTQEATEQNKPLTAHWAHLTIHGTLHLCGYDHIDPNDADIMETLEIKLLKKLGFPNPYQTT